MNPLTVWFRKSVWTIATVTLMTVSSLLADEAKPQETPQTPKVEFSQVYFRYIPEENFQRIREFFTGEESLGSRKILRSDAQSRSGFYYILRTRPAWDSLPEGTILRVHYIPAGGLREIAYDFQLGDQLQGWSGEVFFGLTGEQWAPVSQWQQPIAWKLVLLAADGEVLASKQSMLWQHPVAD